MKNSLRILFGTTASVILLLFSPAQADWTPYNFLLTAAIKPLPNYLRYANSSLSPVDKATVVCTNVSGDGSSSPYESIWFCRGQPYGLERSGPLPVDSGSAIGIQINFNSPPGPMEIKAAVQTILRLYLDSRLNKNPVMTVIVPDEQFAEIVTALGDEHFQPFQLALEVPVQIASNLFIQDNSKKHSTSVCYAPGSFQ